MIESIQIFLTPESLVYIALGALLLALWFALRLRSTRERLVQSEQRLERIFGDREELSSEVEALRESQLNLVEQRATLQAERDFAKQKVAEQALVSENLEKRVEETFKNLSSKALIENNQSFLEVAKTSLTHFYQSAKDDFKHREERIGTLVKPIEESLMKMQKQVQEVEKDREGAYRGLLTQVKLLSETQGKLESETSKLVRSLRTPSVRGRWGEIQLRRVVELAGMVEHSDFTTQAAVDSPESRARPDLIVHLPGGKVVVVDAKAPVQAYLDAVQADSDEEREKEYARHVRHVRTHITQLSGKAYWRQFEQTPEFVVLFLPGECFFSVAVERDPGLIEFGMENNVVVATPTTLIALLRSVAYGWDQAKLTEHATEVRRLGRELYDRISVFGSHLGDLRKGLVKSVEGYNKAVGSLESRIFVSARRLGDLVSKESVSLDPIDPIESLPRLSQLSELGDTDLEESSLDNSKSEVLP